MKGFSYNTRSNLGAWGWTLNLPSGSDLGLAGFHEINAHTFLLKTFFRVVQVPLVTQGLQGRMGPPDPPVVLVLLEVQDLLESGVSPAYQEKKVPQEHKERG